MHDTLRNVETPEGIELQLAIAGPVARGLAYGVDLLIRLGIYIALSFVLVLQGATPLGQGLYLISIFLMEWFYPVFFEVLRDGQTPGKSAFDLRVIHDDGTPVSLSGSIIRNMLRVVDFLPVLNGFGLIAMLLNKDFKRMGDMVAATVVVYRDASKSAAQLPDTKPVAPHFALNQLEQQALLSFAERSRVLNEERSSELAELVGPLTGKQHHSAQEIYGVANWIAGKR